ncbi:MAG: AgmX/PglI C-terminal domain-containing protein [Minicystis sp.]
MAAAKGFGLGSIGTIGHGEGTGTGQGFGAGHGRLGGSHRRKPPGVRMGTVSVNGRLPPEVIQRIVRQNFGRFRLCYENGLRNNPVLQGRVAARFTIGRDGSVNNVTNGGSDLPDPAVVSCVLRAFPNLSFPQPEGGTVTVTFPIHFMPDAGDFPPTSSPPLPSTRSTPTSSPAPAPLPSPKFSMGPYEGKLAEVMDALGRGDTDGALAKAIAFWKASPGDVLALVSLGEAFEAKGEVRSAARAYGSIIDLFASRADLRRMAGERLERLAPAYALALAADSYEKSVQQRPDHPAGHRLLAYARLRSGDPAGAFDAIEAGARRQYPSGRFAGVDQILREDMGILGAAWIKADPAKEQDVKRRLQSAGTSLATTPSLRFVLVWETDNNDVDFHIHDGKGGHAYYASKNLPSGGSLYADVTTGYGPECFNVPLAPEKRALPYRLQAHYYSRGPMGYGMGKLQILDHDGHGGLTFEDRPFVVMQDRAYVELGSYPALKPMDADPPR